MIIRRAVAALFVAGSALAAGPGPFELVMPDAKVLAGINLDKVRPSPLGQYLRALVPEGTLREMIDAAGFDPRRDLSEIVLASAGEPGNRYVVIGRGTFDVPRIMASAAKENAVASEYKGAPTLAGQDARDLLAFPDATLAIVGDPASVRAALDRRGSSPVLSADLATRAQALRASQDFWFVSLVSLDQFHVGPPVAETLLSKAQQSSGGVKLGDPVTVEMEAVAASEKDATGLAAALKMVAGMVRSSKNQGAAGATLLRGLNVTVEGTAVKLSLSVAEADLEQVLSIGSVNRPIGGTPPAGGAVVR
jgi:hypothetical protein